MSRAMETAAQEADGWKKYALASYYVVAGNFSLSVVGFGLLLIASGVALEPILMDSLGFEYYNIPVMAGIFGIWGISLVIAGSVSYTFFWTNKKYAEMTAT